MNINMHVDGVHGGADVSIGGINVNVNTHGGHVIAGFDLRGKFDFGYIMLQTEKPFYEPGDSISGTIYLKCAMPVDAKYIEIEVKGKEKASWMD